MNVRSLGNLDTSSLFAALLSKMSDDDENKDSSDKTSRGNTNTTTSVGGEKSKKKKKRKKNKDKNGLVSVLHNEDSLNGLIFKVCDFSMVVDILFGLFRFRRFFSFHTLK